MPKFMVGMRGRPVRMATRSARGVGASGRLVRRMGTRTYVAARKAAGTRTATKLLYYRKRSSNLRRKVVKSSQGGLPSLSKFILSSPPSARVSAMKKVGAANYFTINDSTHTSTDEGFQGGATFSYNGLSDLKQIIANVPESLDIAQGGPLIKPPKQFCLESAHGEYLITNATNATAYVDIYDIVRLRDAGAPGLVTTENPYAAWVQGVQNENGVGVNSALNLTSLPTDSRQFKDWFKIKRRTHIGLQVGATHRHIVDLKPNRIIDSELLTYVSGDLAKLTVYTMVVYWGQPVSSKVEGSDVATTTAKIALDIVRSVRYKYTWVADQTNNFYFQDNLVSLAEPEVFFNPGSGLIDTVQTTF